jgi:hypothetical protein
MGGACEAIIRGNTPKEMIDNGAKHLMESEDPGDKKARDMMEEMQNNPEEQKKWETDFARKFAELPEG